MIISAKKILTGISVICLLLCNSFNLVAQTKQTEAKTSGDPLIMIDGKEILKSEMENINPEDISTVTIIRKESLITYGEKGKNGVILIETKAYSRERFQNYFSQKSVAYKAILTKHPDGQGLQYFLNGKVLKKNYEGDLASIADTTFISLDIIDTIALKEYGVAEKRYGVVIKTKVKDKKNIKELPKSKFEPEILILSPGKTRFDPSAAKSIEDVDKKLAKQPADLTQELATATAENSRKMITSAQAFLKNLNFFTQISIHAQGYLAYRFQERFPNTLVLLKDTIVEDNIEALARIAEKEKMPYVLNFPSMHIVKEKGQFLLQLKVQLYELESNSLLVDKEYTGDQRNQGFEFSCDGSINCTINNALSAAMVDVISGIASNNRTLKAEQLLKQERYSVLKNQIYPKPFDGSLIQNVISARDSTVNTRNLYQTLYNNDSTKFIGFFHSKVEKQNLKSLSENKKDNNVKILSESNIRDKDFLDVPQHYAYLVKGILSNGRWYYKKDKVTYFKAQNEQEGKLKYFNNLQNWGYFDENLTTVSADFWEGTLFEKIPDRRKDPNWDKYKEMWESEVRENKDYIGMYELVAERLKDEKAALESLYNDSLVKYVFRPFYEGKIKTKSNQISGYNSVLKDFLLIYGTDKNVILNPMEIKDDNGITKVRYFVFLPRSGEIFEWNYFPTYTKKKGEAENNIMQNLSTVTKWNYSYAYLDDEQFWKSYVLLKTNGVYRYLTPLN